MTAPPGADYEAKAHYMAQAVALAAYAVDMDDYHGAPTAPTGPEKIAGALAQSAAAERERCVQLLHERAKEMDADVLLRAADAIAGSEATGQIKELRAQNAELMAALEVLSEEADSFNVSGVYFNEPCMGHKGLEMARAALGIKQGGGE